MLFSVLRLQSPTLSMVALDFSNRMEVCCPFHPYTDEVWQSNGTEQDY